MILHLFRMAAITVSTILLAWPLPAESAPPRQSSKPLDEGFELGGGKGAYHAWGAGRIERFYIQEFLPACFERTLALKQLDAGRRLEWVFTGDRAGITVTIAPERISLLKRYYDSFAFNLLGKRHRRHPEISLDEKEAELKSPPGSVTVRMDHRHRFTVLADGREVLSRHFLQDLHRHQLQLAGKDGVVSGRIRGPAAKSSKVRVDPTRLHQTMIGFGGIATPTAYAQLSPAGKRRWWRLVCEYNLLIQREYPNGRRLSPAMDNWDRLADATPHYYGDNFPNGEISDFDYIRTLRRLGGQVWFEFWDLPPWAGNDVGKYVEVMVNYCKTSKAKAGAPPDVVGIQNEKKQSPERWHRMTLALRKGLDRAGFQNVRIHMSDSGTLTNGIARAKAFAKSKEAWDVIDYAATHMYDYQGCFHDPDRYDAALREWKKVTAGKPFLSTELCINQGKYQVDSYRAALTMGQLYHKNLVIAGASAICYCWTLLNVTQPSYGATRSLCVPDPQKGFVPVASSRQLRVFGAFSRRIRKGMRRVDAQTEDQDLLVSAYAGCDGSKTVVMLNRGTAPRRVRVAWEGARFEDLERSGPYHPNAVEPAGEPDPDGAFEVVVEGGSIATLTSAQAGNFDR